MYYSHVILQDIILCLRPLLINMINEGLRTIDTINLRIKDGNMFLLSLFITLRKWTYMLNVIHRSLSLKGATARAIDVVKPDLDDWIRTDLEILTY